MSQLARNQYWTNAEPIELSEKQRNDTCSRIPRNPDPNDLDNTSDYEAIEPHLFSASFEHHHDGVGISELVDDGLATPWMLIWQAIAHASKVEKA